MTQTTYKKILFLSVLIVVAFFSVSIIQAQITNPAIGDFGQATEASSGQSFLTYMVILWQAVISIGGLVVLLYFVWGAIEWITAGGDSGKIQKARDKIVQSVVGLIILVSSFVILGTINTAFFSAIPGSGFDLLNLQFPSANTQNTTAPAPNPAPNPPQGRISQPI